MLIMRNLNLISVQSWTYLLSIKMNNNRAEGLISIALPGFNSLGRLVTLLFFAETDFICNHLHIVQK